MIFHCGGVDVHKNVAETAHRRNNEEDRQARGKNLISNQIVDYNFLNFGRTTTTTTAANNNSEPNPEQPETAEPPPSP
jgi:hypothetical protein